MWEILAIVMAWYITVNVVIFALVMFTPFKTDGPEIRVAQHKREKIMMAFEIDPIRMIFIGCFMIVPATIRAILDHLFKK